MSAALQKHLNINTTPVPSFTPAQKGLLQRKCTEDKCDERKKRLNLQRSSIIHSDFSMVPPIVHEALHSPGQPLDSITHTFMESHFGHDFSRVRVHTDTKAVESAKAVNARAYTVGEDVVFGEGQYSPGTYSGRHLIAHELAHTIQQQRSPHLQRQREVAAPSDLETMLDTAISIVQQALDVLITPAGKGEAQPASAGDEDRAQSLRIALDNLLALKGSGREDDILRAVQPILAAAGRGPVGTQKIKAIQRKAMAVDRDDVFEREVEAAADRVSQGDMVEDMVQQRISHSSTLIIQRQGGPAEATMGTLVVAGGPPAWAIAAGVAVVAIIIYAATRPRSKTKAKERAEPTTGGPSRPPPDICHTAIKILTQYERLAKKLGKNIPPSRIAELDRLRDAGTITINHIPGGLRSEFPGIFADMTLAAIRAMCGM